MIKAQRMCKTAYVFAALLTSACTGPGASVDSVFAPSSEPDEGTNGGPPWFTTQLVRVMDGNGHLNSAAHRRYEAKARAIMVVPDGPVHDPIDQELLGATLGLLTNTSGITVRLHFAVVAAGDYPGSGWKREDRAHMFMRRGPLDVEAFYCLGDDVDRGVRDQRRADTFNSVAIGAFTNVQKWCGDISGYQQRDQAYGDVTPDTRTYEKTSVLGLLADPNDEDEYYCVQSGECALPACEGSLALFGGEYHCMPCAAAYIDFSEEGPGCAPEEETGGKEAGVGDGNGEACEKCF